MSVKLEAPEHIIPHAVLPEQAHHSVPPHLSKVRVITKISVESVSDFHRHIAGIDRFLMVCIRTLYV